MGNEKLKNDIREALDLVVVDQTWGVALKERDSEGFEVLLFASWGDSYGWHESPDESLDLAVEFLAIQDWFPSDGPDAALQAFKREQKISPKGKRPLCSGRKPRCIATWATAATVVRWATRGSKRLRAKYRHALTACRILNRRESYVLGCVPAIGGAYGLIDVLKFSWGVGHPKHGERNGCSVGWYGKWFVETDDRGRALYSFADLRAEYRERRPQGGLWSDPSRLVGDCCASLRALRRP